MIFDHFGKTARLDKIVDECSRKQVIDNGIKAKGQLNLKRERVATKKILRDMGRVGEERDCQDVATMIVFISHERSLIGLRYNYSFCRCKMNINSI